MPLSILRYALISTVLLFGFSIRATDGVAYGDFWEHSAVLRSLLTAPNTHSHPLFATFAAHAFLSPYTFAVAGFAKAFHASNIDALLLTGLFNFLLLVFGLLGFCKFASKEESWLGASYALICMLFLWGSNPWGYSGFLHYSQTADVLPYPSTFALGITFVGLWLQQRALTDNKIRLTLVVYFFYCLVLLTHPLTAIFFTCALIGQSWCTPEKQRNRAVLLTILGLVGALCLATQWPYFSIIDLFAGAGSVYHPENRSMYVDVLSRIWPTLVSLPLIAWAFRNKRGQAVLLTILMLCGVYVYGGITEKYSFGRVISIIMILLQILIGVGAARLELRATRKIAVLKISIPLILFTTLIHFSLPWLTSTTTRALTVFNSVRLGRPISNQISYKDLLFLKDYISDDSVVLSDLDTSWIVPSIRGKVIGALHPQAFVPDQRQRFDDVNLFFTNTTSDTQRLWLAEKYQAQYLLLNKGTTKNYAELKQLFIIKRLATIVYDSEHYVLLKLPLL